MVLSVWGLTGLGSPDPGGTTIGLLKIPTPGPCCSGADVLLPLFDEALDFKMPAPLFRPTLDPVLASELAVGASSLEPVALFDDDGACRLPLVPILETLDDELDEVLIPVGPAPLRLARELFAVPTVPALPVLKVRMLLRVVELNDGIGDRERAEDKVELIEVTVPCWLLFLAEEGLRDAPAGFPITGAGPDTFRLSTGGGGPILIFLGGGITGSCVVGGFGAIEERRAAEVEGTGAVVFPLPHTPFTIDLAAVDKNPNREGLLSTLGLCLAEK